MWRQRLRALALAAATCGVASMLAGANGCNPNGDERRSAAEVKTPEQCKGYRFTWREGGALAQLVVATPDGFARSIPIDRRTGKLDPTTHHAFGITGGGITARDGSTRCVELRGAMDPCIQALSGVVCLELQP